MLWRRSYDVPPPPIDSGSEFSQDGDPRYAGLGDAMPTTECLADVVARFLPYWESAVVPDLRDGKVVLLAAHGNSLRALVKHLDGISDADIAELNIPTGIPRRRAPRRGGRAGTLSPSRGLGGRRSGEPRVNAGRKV